jgi:vancomycin resistance protein YoaR
MLCAGVCIGWGLWQCASAGVSRPVRLCGRRASTQWTPLVEFATSLEGRTPGQRHNATLAAKRVHGATLAPNAEWSFNQTIGQWVRSEGYVRAPVSYGGVLVPAWGGGVCQTSTTLYNAALLAGLEVLERHPHTIAPSYIAPGRDAAVAQGIADLKLRNPYPFPCRIECFIRGDKLVCRISAGASAEQVRPHARACTLETEVVSRAPAPARSRTSASSPDARDCACACGASALRTARRAANCATRRSTRRCPAAKQHPHRV